MVWIYNVIHNVFWYETILVRSIRVTLENYSVGKLNYMGVSEVVSIIDWRLFLLVWKELVRKSGPTKWNSRSSNLTSWSSGNWYTVMSLEIKLIYNSLSPLSDFLLMGELWWLWLASISKYLSYFLFYINIRANTRILFNKFTGLSVEIFTIGQNSRCFTGIPSVQEEQ